MLEATRLHSKLRRARPVAASYVPFPKPLRKLDSAVNYRAEQGFQRRSDQHLCAIAIVFSMDSFVSPGHSLHGRGHLAHAEVRGPSRFAAGRKPGLSGGRARVNVFEGRHPSEGESRARVCPPRAHAENRGQPKGRGSRMGPSPPALVPAPLGDCRLPPPATRRRAWAPIAGGACRGTRRFPPAPRRPSCCRP